jgi:hypothetical protein
MAHAVASRSPLSEYDAALETALSLSRLRRRAQGGEKLLLSDRFLQGRSDLPRSQWYLGVSRNHHNANPLVMQPIDQSVGQLTPSEVEVDERHVWREPGDQTLGIGPGSDRPHYLRAQCPKMALQADAQVPGILDYEDAHALQIQFFRFRRTWNVR